MFFFSRVLSFFRLARLRALFRWSRLRRVLFLVLALGAITWWQRGFMRETSVVPATNMVTASTGINLEKKFFFFLYHLGLFPVASDVKPGADTADEARRLMRASPKALRMDEGSTFRSGDRGRTFLYFVDALVRHDALDPSLRPAHSYAFTLALCALFTAFWAIRRSWAGALLVALLGSNPFQLHAIYRQENVFSWTITTFVIALAIHVPLLDRPRTRWRFYPWFAAVATGLTFAFVRNMRGEMTVLLASPVLVYVTATALRKRVRAALVLVLAGTFYLGTLASTSYIDGKLKEAATAVSRAGGSPYEGPIAHFHEFWHVMWCGLGDFDTTKGYEWSDGTAYAYAMPELKRLNPGLDIQWNNAQKRTYDADGKYPVYFVEIPFYNELLRDKILGDIKSDPWWYAHILRLRFTKTLSMPTPVGVALWNRNFYATGSLLTWGCFPLAALLAIRRRWALLKMLVFGAPLTLAPVLVYSGGGMTNYSSFHIVGAWIFVVLLLERAMRDRRTPRAARLSHT